MSELNWQQITNLYTEIVTESRKEQVKTEKELELKTEDVDGELITEQIAEKESKLITGDVLQLTEELVTEQIAEQVTERNTEHVMELTRKVTSMNAVLEPETITGNEPCTHAKVGHQSSENNPTFKRQTCVARRLPCGASAVATQFNRPYRKCRSNIQQYLLTFRKKRATSAVDEAQHKCQKCNRTFKTKSSLYYHLQRICCKEERFKCLYCSKRTKKFGSIYAHVRKYHEGFEVCAQDIDRDCIMKLYQPRTSVNGQFKCPYCEYRANNRNYVYKHVRKFHKTSEVCALDLKMNNAVLKPGDRKMNGRDAGAEKKYQCKKCNSRFTSKSYLHRHLRYICGQEPRFKCPYCCSNNKYFNDIYGHIRKHHKDFDKHAQNMDRDCVVKPQQTLKALEAPFKCPYCNVRFKITSSIYKHIRNCHKGSKVYAYVNEDCINKPHIAKELLGSFSRCPYCKLRSMYRTSIYRHVRAVHKTKEVYALDAAGNVLKPLKHKLN